MTEPEANVPASGEATAEMGAGQRIVGAFMDPVETFASIARKPDFWVPLILMVILSVVFVELFLSRVSMQAVVLHQLEASGRASQMSSAQLQRSVQIATKVGGITARAAGIVGVPLAILILALLGMGIIKVLSGNVPQFKRMWSVSTYALLPSALRSVASILVVLFGDPASFTSANISPTNLGFFLSQQSVSKPLYTIATSLDPFTFWVMVLLGIGGASVSAGKVRARTCFFSFLALWIFWLLIKVGLAAI
jgi:hypothetical protein